MIGHGWMEGSSFIVHIERHGGDKTAYQWKILQKPGHVFRPHGVALNRRELKRSSIQFILLALPFHMTC